MIPKLTEDKYNEYFRSFKKLTLKKLPYIYSVDQLSDELHLSSKEINFLVLNREKAYSTFHVPKKNGSVREINAPSNKMKNIQKWILHHILYKLDSGSYSHGFVPSKSIVSNAKVHVNQDLVLGIDIKDFFPSVDFESVYFVFKSAGYTKKISWLLASLCTYNEQLPQGAPTSPMIANLVALKLDSKIAKYCSRWGYNYSRYADDITISGSSRLPMRKQKLIKIIEQNGFDVNKDKTRMFSRGSRQVVTGLVVNDKVSLGKKKKRVLRALVHNVLVNGPVAENRSNDPFFRERLFGHLGNANSIEPAFAKPLISSLKSIDWSEYNESIKDIKENNLNVNRIKRIPKTFLVKFDELGFFRHIAEIPSAEFSEDFIEQLNGLKEKCDRNIHGVEACSDCLDIKKEIYKTCIKFIIGHYTGTTGGHHHGHEIYDMKATTDYEGETVAVAFLMKSGTSNTSKESSLFTQAFDCTDYDSIDLIAITSNYNLTNKLCERLEKMIRYNNKGNDKEQLYCLIMRNEMKRILFDFNKKTTTPFPD